MTGSQRFEHRSLHLVSLSKLPSTNAAAPAAGRCYHPDVVSKLAEAHQKEQRRVERALTPVERLRLAQRLGDEAVAQFAHAHGVAPIAAVREFARRRQLGRRPSRCLAGR